MSAIFLGVNRLLSAGSLLSAVLQPASCLSSVRGVGRALGHLSQPLIGDPGGDLEPLP